MILESFGELNWLAILVATVAWFAFSAIWYSVPPISAAWQRAAKVTASEGPPLIRLLAPTFVGYLVTTMVIALVAKATGENMPEYGVLLGVVLGVGFGVVGALITQLYEQKGSYYWLINGIHAIVGYTIVAVIIAVWD